MPFLNDAAIHEAGHAFMTLYVGQSVKRMNVRVTEERSGVTYVNKWGSMPGWEKAHILIAGYAADLIDGVEKEPLACAWDDVWELGNVGLSRAMAEELTYRVTDILVANWAIVMDLATELDARGSLSGRKVQAIYDRHEVVKVEPTAELRLLACMRKDVNAHA